MLLVELGSANVKGRRIEERAAGFAAQPNSKLEIGIH
jgi:hypothetical protein